MNKILKHIPIFPLNGALLLPGGNLPLNIFEPRYIDMVDYALSKDKTIGMIQTQEDKSKVSFKVGCVGKISSFSETDDQRYLINLRGVSRFEILEEIKHDKDFKIFNVEYENPKNTFANFNSDLFNKNNFINKILEYLKEKGMNADLESLLQIDSKALIIMIAMICPFNINEKQMLLESKDINHLIEIIESRGGEIEYDHTRIIDEHRELARWLEENREEAWKMVRSEKMWNVYQGLLKQGELEERKMTVCLKYNKTDEEKEQDKKDKENRDSCKNNCKKGEKKSNLLMKLFTSTFWLFMGNSVLQRTNKY